MKLVININILIFLSLFICSDCQANNFFKQRNRGWLWFEEQERRMPKEKKQKQEIEQHRNITPEAARNEIENYAKELEEAKYVMLARPTIENVKAYRDKEEEMWEKGFQLEDAWRLASFAYPELNNNLSNPTSVPALKLKREVEAEENTNIIKEFASTFDLVLFFSTACKYCQKFSPVLKNFGENYGFNIEAISADGGSQHEYFRTIKAGDLITKLGIEAFPTVVAISKDGKQAFELIRGYVTIPQLEEYTVMASEYLKLKNQKSKIAGEE